MISIRRIEQATPAEREGLVALLIDTVDGGASVGFLAPLAPQAAEEYWRDTLASLGPGKVLWVAEQEGRILGSVQLAPSLRENSPHRAELQKLFVHSSARGQGLGSRLLDEVERFARSRASPCWCSTRWRVRRRRPSTCTTNGSAWVRSPAGRRTTTAS